MTTTDKYATIQTSHAKDKLAAVERIRNRIEKAMHRESERDVDVAHDRLELRIRAAVMTVLDEEVDQQREWVRGAEEHERRSAGQ